MKPKVTKFDYTYKKPESDVWNLDVTDIPLDMTHIKEQRIVHFGPKSIGGNHKHPRTEWFIGFGDLVFHWLDENGEKQHVSLKPDRQVILIEVPPNLVHAVENNSDTENAIIMEYADGPLEQVEKIQII